LFEVMRRWVADAVARGEVRAAVDPDRLVELIGGATLLAMFLRPDDQLGGDWARQTADILAHGVLA
ncbi:MAG: TetR/AcrR family transcriptional regulator C-terminal ligand-binding domain-containing protein, partial [Actinomycetota bacterium]|nr:TetR/AcrR family transcriptional regulator C-terminal ligand-binding domain-containing protein [Actinomycetota bacterium]